MNIGKLRKKLVLKKLIWEFRYRKLWWRLVQGRHDSLYNLMSAIQLNLEFYTRLNCIIALPAECFRSKTARDKWFKDHAGGTILSANKHGDETAEIKSDKTR